MCGISGIINFFPQEDSEDISSIIKRMSAKLIHRGPDDSGVWLNESSGVAFGHRRLSIIDTSVKGHQPMSNEDGTVWIIFNGEIYNFKELKSDLSAKGHRFKSKSDTEAVIHLYEDYGEDCVRYLRGMFAFAIWDEKKQMLLLARDRVGKKPLLYYLDEKSFCFSSEFDSLLSSGLIQRKIRAEAIDYYLALGYIPSPLTIYDKVRKLPPAHILVFQNGEVKLRRYWNLNYCDKLKISEDEAGEEILRLLKEAVKIRLYSDVPLGAFLSGGIDSSTVVGIMSSFLQERVKTFSIGFTESDYSELKYARRIAEKFNTAHNEFIVKPDALKILPLLVEHYGEPYADSSCIPTYYVSQQTRRYVTVALNGDGGDELFAGYERYQGMLLAEAFNRMPRLFRKIALQSSRFLFDSSNPKNRIRNVKRFFSAAALSSAERYLRWISIFNDTQRDNLYSQDFKKNMPGQNMISWLGTHFNKEPSADILDKILSMDTSTYLPDDLLVKVDIASMANSLEVRSPFLDHKLMEFVARLPSEYKMKNLIKKYILKKVIKDIVPRENIYRRKMGFALPVGNWLRNELREFLIENVDSPKFYSRGYFNPAVVKGMLNKHINKGADYSYQLWSLLMLELWHQRFID